MRVNGSFLIPLSPLLDSYARLLSLCLSPAHRRCERRSRGERRGTEERGGEPRREEGSRGERRGTEERGGEPRREEGKQQAVREMRTPVL